MDNSLFSLYGKSLSVSDISKNIGITQKNLKEIDSFILNNSISLKGGRTVTEENLTDFKREAETLLKRRKANPNISLKIYLGNKEYRIKFYGLYVLYKIYSLNFKASSLVGIFRDIKRFALTDKRIDRETLEIDHKVKGGFMETESIDKGNISFRPSGLRLDASGNPVADYYFTYFDRDCNKWIIRSNSTKFFRKHKEEKFILLVSCKVTKPNLPKIMDDFKRHMESGEWTVFEKVENEWKESPHKTTKVYAVDLETWTVSTPEKPAKKPAKKSVKKVSKKTVKA